MIHEYGPIYGLIITFIKQLLPFCLLLTLLITLICLVISISKNQINKKTTLKTIGVLILLVSVGFLVRATLFENTSFNWNDQSWSINSAQNFAYSWDFYNCHAHDTQHNCIEKCDFDILATQPIFYFIIFKTLGFDVDYTFGLMFFFSILTIIATFYLLLILYKNVYTALIGTSLLIFNIISCIFSKSPEVRVTSGLMLVSMLLFFFLYLKHKRICDFLLTLSFFTFLIQSFPEYIAIGILIFALIVINYNKIKTHINPKIYLIILFLFFIINIPFLLSLQSSLNENPDWKAGEGFFSIGELKKNISDNLVFFFGYSKENPNFTTLKILSYLSIISVILAIKNKSKTNIALGLTVAFYFLFYTTHKLGWLTGNLRYTLIIILLMVVLSTYSISELIKKNKKNKIIIITIFLLLVSGLFCLDFFNYKSNYKDIYYLGKENKIDYIKEFTLPKGKHIVLSSPALYTEAILGGRSTIDLFFAKKFLNNLSKNDNITILYFKNYFFEQICVKRNDCEQEVNFKEYLEKNYEMELVSKPLTHENETFGIYKVNYP
ncbi:MAG: hypothetical protein ACQESF_05400 [Nanobdellota archaeon]